MKKNFAFALLLSASLLCSCGGAKEVKEKAIGFSSTCTYTEYTDLGGYGSDFTAFSHLTLTLYDDNSYILESVNPMYAGAWNIIITEHDNTVFGTYTTTNEDEYGISVDLSAATKVTSYNVVSSTITYNDSDKVDSFTATEEKTAQQLRDELITAYSSMGKATIDFEGNKLTLENTPFNPKEAA